jgi:hypothetical protein
VPGEAGAAADANGWDGYTWNTGGSQQELGVARDVQQALEGVRAVVAELGGAVYDGKVTRIIPRHWAVGDVHRCFQLGVNRW